VRYIYPIIKADYLQRTRSYAFLITLAITVYGAYSFVPPPSANYTTLTIPGYTGVYNSAWVGYISAMMTTIMVSLWGFFLINSGIQKDIDTEVGLIVATTRITNLSYLLSKFLSNFLVLLSITAVTFLVSILMFFVRRDGYPLVLSDFILPYILFAIPALFFVSALAVAAEVFLRGNTILKSIAFIFLFGLILGRIVQTENSKADVLMDVFGIKTMSSSVLETVNAKYHTNIQAFSMGFNYHRHKQVLQTYTWTGISWTTIFLLSRLLWIFMGLAVVYISSLFFHRFDFKQSLRSKKRIQIAEPAALIKEVIYSEPVVINLSKLPKLTPNYGIWPLIKTEFLLLIRKGSRWMWLIVAAVWIAMIFVQLPIVYGILLPVLWFLQVNRWSELATKEKANRLHYFTYSSYEPLKRMLPAQILAGTILAIVLALPLIVRLGLLLNGYAVFNIVNGGVFAVLLAVCLGVVSGGKKLYEVLFFMITYVLVQNGTYVDYLGALSHDSHFLYIAVILALNITLVVTSFTVRQYQARHL
jgi:hypothetical protein